MTFPNPNYCTSVQEITTARGTNLYKVTLKSKKKLSHTIIKRKSTNGLEAVQCWKLKDGSESNESDSREDSDTSI